jgi:DNA (cytosine-5)-methyltransferase 1
MRAISLFTGAGGLDLGFERAGFSTVAAVEANAAAQDTLAANRRRFFKSLADGAVFDDIMTISPAALREFAGRHEVSLVHGGPPCTPFSKSGYWLEYKRRGADPKASLLDSFADVVAAVRPHSFVMENVFALAYRNHNRAVFQRFLARMRAAGYATDHAVLVAGDYGVPQLRQRVFCVGLRSDLLDVPDSVWRFAWPEPTHTGPHETRLWQATLPPHVTAGTALRGLDASLNPPEPEEVVRGTYADELRAVPPGDNYLFLTAKRGHPAPRFTWRSRYWSFLLKLHPDRPAPTIQGQPGPWVGPFHWESRRLRVAEVKRLMTFPDEFVVTGSRRDQQLQLGNAVPPLLAERIARELAAVLAEAGAGDTNQLAAAA